MADGAVHLKALTSLRFFAALMVVLLHIGAKLDPAQGSAGIFSLGYLGVTFFFILSGFVLTWTFREGDRAGTFYGRRFARVWPLHAVTTAAAGAIILVQTGGLNFLAAPFVFTLTQAFVPDSTIYYAFNSASWSLSCEAFFYALFPLLIARSGRVRHPLRLALLLWVALAAVTFALVFSASTLSAVTGASTEGLVGYTLNIFPGYRFGEFAIGVFLALAVRRGWRCPIGAGTAISLTVAVLASLTIVDQVYGFTQPAFPSFLSIPAFSLLIVASASHDLRGLTGVLHHPALVALGQSSFALYLVHGWIVTVGADYLGGNVWLGGVIVLALSIAVAEVAHRCVERPAERALRRRIGGRQAVPSTR